MLSIPIASFPIRWSRIPNRAYTVFEFPLAIWELVCSEFGTVLNLIVGTVMVWWLLYPTKCFRSGLSWSADPAPDWESRSAPRQAKIGPKKGKKEGQAVLIKKFPIRNFFQIFFHNKSWSWSRSRSGPNTATGWIWIQWIRIRSTVL